MTGSDTSPKRMSRRVTFIAEAYYSTLKWHYSKSMTFPKDRAGTIVLTTMKGQLLCDCNSEEVDPVQLLRKSQAV